MKMKNAKTQSLVALLLLLSLSFGCASGSKGQGEKVDGAHMEMATAWVQSSGEWIALCYQAFSLAKIRLDQQLQKTKGSKLAVVVDIDETVLDNSPFQAQSIFDKTGYPTGWEEWVQLGRAKPVPGAAEFLQYAASKGVEVYYVSNRKEVGYDATWKNLQDYKFPLKRKEQLLLRTKESSKEVRRDLISKSRKIALLIGDNLADFADEFETKTVAARNAEVEKSKKHFGDSYIVIPNPMYGDWEAVMYEMNFGLDQEAKRQKRYEAMQGI
jgi:5'-nucleotidase (lipoprotein e(P4) family)